MSEASRVQLVKAEANYRLAFHTWESLIRLSIDTNNVHFEALAEQCARQLPPLLVSLIDAREIDRKAS
jgi:hypothetical protein